MKLEIFFHGVDMVEYVVDDPGDDPLLGGIVDDPFHGVGLPAGGLPVGKYCSIVSIQNI